MHKTSLAHAQNIMHKTSLTHAHAHAHQVSLHIDQYKHVHVVFNEIMQIAVDLHKHYEI